MINICSDILSEKIVDKVNHAKIFLVMAVESETTESLKKNRWIYVSVYRYIDFDS